MPAASPRPASVRLIDAYGSIDGPVKAGLRHQYAQDAQQFVPARRLPTVLGEASEHMAMFRERFMALRKILWRELKRDRDLQSTYLESSGNPSFVDAAVEKIASDGTKMPKIRIKGQQSDRGMSSGMMERICISSHMDDVTVEEPPAPEDQSLLKPQPNERVVVTAVENLPGNPGVKFVFGLLSRASEGALHIEDIHQSVRLDFSKCLPSAELIVADASFVIMKGEMSILGDGILHVLEMMMPPRVSRRFCDPTLDIFGSTIRDNQLGSHSGLLEISEIGQPGLESAEDLMVVVIGEVHLDDENTFDKLADILYGFDRMDQPPPAVYVFMGNFTKKAVNLRSAKCVREYRACWARLSEELERFPNDPACVGGLLPVPALSDQLTEGIARKFKGVHMCSNPARIRMDLGGQVVEEDDLSNKADFTVFRSPDVCRKLYDNCIVRRLESMVSRTKEERQMATNREFMRAIIHQGHLCPVSQEVQPVIWGLDHILQLHAPPNAVFICDPSVTPCEEVLESDLVFCSTGQFKKSLTDDDDEGYPFYVYRPFARDYRDCLERSNAASRAVRYCWLATETNPGLLSCCCWIMLISHFCMFLRNSARVPRPHRGMYSSKPAPLQKTIMHPHSALVMYRNRGGHLLQNEDIITRILVAARIRPSDTVLEMGPGTGNMTIKLSELANRVVAMEVNEGLAKEVERRAEMKGTSNMEVVTGDFKRLALPRFDVVIANLPYHLATGFLLKLMGQPFRTGIIMLQHEFGKKLLADPGEKIYSRLSLNMRMFFKAERICKVPGRAFFPQPQTTSVIIRLTPRVPAPKEWDAMIRIAFFRKNQDVFKMFKRLTVLNMLEHNYKMWCSINRVPTSTLCFRDYCLEALDQCNLTFKKARRMDYHHFERLLEAFHKKGIYFVNFATAPPNPPGERFVPSFAEEGYKFYDPDDNDDFLSKIEGPESSDSTDSEEDDENEWLPC
ncbi:DNA polymerase epsilon subunit 2 [Perkinsus chesapeaki]|uniref:DNA polymerase II subunit 2 n=1 Tax=Perkinsus chesapeaki TaxID=330153 RepID=A0A7J6N308_PERCH|nr:DNA polymerase epsilon subunit 2 [Perkinsus chesapeaki]